MKTPPGLRTLVFAAAVDCLLWGAVLGSIVDGVVAVRLVLVPTGVGLFRARRAFAAIGLSVASLLILAYGAVVPALWVWCLIRLIRRRGAG